MPEQLYTLRFWRACAVHFTGAMALAQFILFPLYIRQLGGTEWTIGLITGVGYAAAVAIRFLAGAWLDRLGRRALLLAAGVVHVASCLLYLTTLGIGPWIVVVTVLHGMAGGVLFATYFTYAADIVPPLRRAEGTAIFGLCGLIPNGLAPPLGERVIAVGGFAAYFVTAAAWALVSLALSTGLPEIERPWGPEPSPAHRWLAVLRKPVFRLPLFATVAFGLGTTAIFTFLAPFAEDSGLGDVGSFFLAYAVAAAVVRLLGGRIPDLVGADRVALPALAVLALGLAAVALIDSYPHLMICVGGVCGAAHGYLFPVLNSLVVARAPAGSWGTVVSLYTAMFDVGVMLGAPILGAVSHAYGYHLMYVVAAGVVAAGFCVMLVGQRAGTLPVARAESVPWEGA